VANLQYDQGITDAGAHDGAQSFRFSNKIADGYIQSVSSPVTSVVVGEPDAGSTSTGLHAGPNSSHLDFSVWFRSVAGSYDGSQMALGADGSGGQMVFVRIDEEASGLKVTDEWSSSLLAAGLSFDVWHQVGASVDFIAGPSNDVVRWYVDGTLAGTTGTWEQYYRSVSQPVPAIDGMQFTTNGLTAAPAAAGLYFDDITLTLTLADGGSIGTGSNGGADSGNAQDGGDSTAGNADAAVGDGGTGLGPPPNRGGYAVSCGCQTSEHWELWMGVIQAWLLRGRRRSGCGRGFVGGRP
jgi:hypothetical protein